jgi:acyl-CoA reductase-like NAD-dependent aldehyde dehydrogenase
VALGKMMNAGQICLAPDYLMVAKEQEAEVIESVEGRRRQVHLSDACSPMMITPLWSTGAIMTGCKAISPSDAKRVRS